MTIISSTLKAVASHDLQEEIDLELETPDKSIASILENNNESSRGDDREGTSGYDTEGGEKAIKKV